MVSMWVVIWAANRAAPGVCTPSARSLSRTTSQARRRLSRSQIAACSATAFAAFVSVLNQSSFGSWRWMEALTTSRLVIRSSAPS